MARARRKDIETVESNLTCVALGRQMTVPERNLMMKLDYINGGLNLKALAEKYDLNYEYVSLIKTKEKWDKEKKGFIQKLQKEAEDVVKEVYVGCKIETTLKYNNAWDKIFNLVMRELDNESEHLRKPDGSIKIGSFAVLSEILERAQKNQFQCMGFVGAENKIKFELQRESLELKKKQLDVDQDEEVREDNFMDALNGVCDELYKED